MSLLKKANEHRRVIMRNLTKNIGTTQINPKLLKKGKFEAKRILISRPNGRLGNLLLITPLLQEIEATFPGCKTDLFIKGNLAPILFKNYPSVDRIIKLPGKPFKELFKYTLAWASIKKSRYDIVINVVNSSSSGRLSTKFASAKIKHFGDVSEEIKTAYADQEHMAKYPVYNFREFLGKLGIQENNPEKPVPPLNLRLDTKELETGKNKLEEITKNDKKTIAVFTYATGAKCYSPEWWNPFYERLKAEFEPEYNIIEILPAENVSQIGFKATSYYSRDIREIGGVMANCAVFIGADSGMMHLASASGVPTAGLFWCTKTESYEPYNEGSTAIDTSKNDIDSMLNIINGILKK